MFSNKLAAELGMTHEELMGYITEFVHIVRPTGSDPVFLSITQLKALLRNLPFTEKVIRVSKLYL